MTRTVDQGKRALLRALEREEGIRLTWDELVSTFDLEDCCDMFRTILGTEVHTMLWLEGQV